METVRESFEGLTSVVQVAVHSDDPAVLVAAASMAARRPVALVGHDGEPLGYAPEGAEGRRALAVATAAARNRLKRAAGWSIVPIARGSAALGFVAIGSGGRRDGATELLLELLPELVVEQQHRLAVLRARGAAFVRQLVSDPRFATRAARSEAAELGLDLADAYWPAILAWHDRVPPRAVVKQLMRETLPHVEGSLSTPLDSAVVLLHPDRRAEPFGWLERIVGRARTLSPSLTAQAIVAEGPVELTGVSTTVAELDALRRMGPRRRGDPPVVSAREFALEQLLWETLDAAASARFVEEHLGPLLAWDREHRTDLVWVLEAALDHPRHDVAAARCFMHRNTFRHRLQQAGEVLGNTLDDPDVRLATHVALKLRRLLAEPPDEGAQGTAPAGESHRPRRRPGGRAMRPRSRRT